MDAILYRVNKSEEINGLNCGFRESLGIRGVRICSLGNDVSTFDAGGRDMCRTERRSKILLKDFCNEI